MKRKIVPEKKSGFPEGFTLVEIMVVIALMAIIAGVAVFGLGKFSRAGRVRASVIDVAAALRRARSEAMASGKVCATTMRGEEDFYGEEEGDAFRTIIPLYRFDNANDALRYDNEDNLWAWVDALEQQKEAEPSLELPFARFAEYYTRKFVMVFKRPRSNGDSGKPLLFFPDGSANDTWVITLRDLDNYDPSTGDYIHPDEVYVIRINRFTGLPEDWNGDK